MSGSQPPIQIVPRRLFDQLVSGILTAMPTDSHAMITPQVAQSVSCRILQDFEEELVVEMVSGIGGADGRLKTAVNR